MERKGPWPCGLRMRGGPSQPSWGRIRSSTQPPLPAGPPAPCPCLLTRAASARPAPATGTPRAEAGWQLRKVPERSSWWGSRVHDGTCTHQHTCGSCLACTDKCMSPVHACTRTVLTHPFPQSCLDSAGLSLAAPPVTLSLPKGGNTAGNKSCNNPVEGPGR